MKKFELKVNKELEAIVPKMTEAEFNSLKDSIANEGQKLPIEVMEDGTIIDGHNRYKACMIVGVEPEYKVIESVKSVEEAKEYAFITNAKRRHIPLFCLAEYGILNRKTEETTEEVAHEVGVSIRTLERVASILNKVKANIPSPDAMGKLRSGELGIETTYNSLNLYEDVKDKLKFVKPEIKEKIKNKFAEYLAIPETISKGIVEWIQHDIDEEKNTLGNAWLKDFYFDKKLFATKEEFENFCEKTKGVSFGLVPTEQWNGRLDRIEVAEAKKEGFKETVVGKQLNIKKKEKLHD